ncbi:hypothetical protein FSARC_11142 [Fusarium sarcochroum]|uniref:Cell wall cysteine-rich protein n=1 Tax=Fusarium sarcochroum TaxID=1208366 RepID=A0A8H4THK4_9HYPO|nr:hypothetical protein FSARC_11142 [Fusarium sarcochroum]
MHRSLRAFLATGLVLSAVAEPEIYYTVPDTYSELTIPQTATSLIPIPTELHVDSKGISRCCPLGTVNDGTDCVFPESSLCEEGTVLDGNVCVSVGGPKCPGDLRFNGRFCQGEDPKCLGISQFNIATGKCESPLSPRCLPKYKFIDGKCQAETGPECPPGYTERNGFCVDNSPPRCPGSDQVFEKGFCVSKYPPRCPDKSSARDGQCFGPEPGCPEGYTVGRGTCWKLPGCTPPYELKGQFCVLEGKQECPGGTFSNGACHGKLQCPAGFTYDQDLYACATTTDMVCGSGWKLFNVPGSSHEKTCCPDKTDDFNGEFCRWQVPDEDNCDEGTEYKDGACHYPPEQVKCPELYNLLNGKCVKRTPPFCEKGTYSDGKCILGSPTCPGESHWNGVDCVATYRPICDEGSHLSGPSCVTEDMPKCPEKHRLDGDNCVHEELPKCSAGTTLVDGYCRHPDVPICKQGSYQNEHCTHPELPICPQGSSVIDGKCVAIQNPHCEQGFQYDCQSKKCVYGGGNPVCKSPLYWDGKACISPLPPKCEDGHVRINNKCISQKVPKCPQGFFFDVTSQGCVATGPTCSKSIPADSPETFG